MNAPSAGTDTGATDAARLSRLLQYIEQDAGNLNLREEAIREACDRRHWETALRLIEAGLLNHPNEPRLVRISGAVYLSLGRYQDAERALATVLEHGWESPELHYNLAFSLFMQTRYADALQRLTPAVEKQLPVAIVLRARCLHHLGDVAEAIGECRRCVALVPEDSDANGLLALLLYESGQVEAVNQHVRTALRSNPLQLEALLSQASMQFDAKELSGTRASFKALLQAHPRCGRAWFGVALLDISQMQLEAARYAIELAAALMPTHIGSWHVLAWLHIMMGEVTAASTAFDRALQLDRTFGETHGGLAVVAALQGYEEQARLYIKRALRLDPQGMAVQYARLLLLQRQGQHESARVILDAFLARPVGRGDAKYRDVVASHMRYLHAVLARPPEHGKLQ